MTCGPEIVFLPPGARIMPTMMVGSANAIGASTGPDANVTGDLCIDTAVGIMSIWTGAGWDDVGPVTANGSHTHSIDYLASDRTYCPCPYCGMLNPPDAIECGADRWNGCGAPLGEQ